MLTLKEIFKDSKRITILRTLKEMSPDGDCIPFTLEYNGEWITTFKAMNIDKSIEQKDGDVKLTVKGLNELNDYDKTWNKSFLGYFGIIALVVIGLAFGLSL